MENKEKVQVAENRENDFIDALVGTMVSTAILMGVFIVATVISLVM